jgi:hypothetical protein
VGQPSVYAVDIVRGNLHGAMTACGPETKRFSWRPWPQSPRRATHDHRV